MMREYQVRICERLGVKFPGPTRQLHALPRRSIAVCFTPVSGIDSRSQALPGRADFVAKVPKYQTTIFLKETKLNHARHLIWHPGPLAKPPMNLSLGDEVPHIFIRESHQRPRKILISGGKRLLQQNRPLPDSCTAAKVPHSIIPLGAVEKLVGTVSHSASDGVIRQSIEALGSAVARVRTRESSVR